MWQSDTITTTGATTPPPPATADGGGMVAPAVDSAATMASPAASHTPAANKGLAANNAPDASPVSNASHALDVSHVSSVNQAPGPAADSVPPRLVTHPDTLMAHGDTLRDVALPAGGAWRPDVWPQPSDTLCQEVALSHQAGVAGHPAPTPLSADDVVTATLLVCFLLAMAGVAKTRYFIARQAKEFFRRPHGHGGATSQTPFEVRFQVFLVAQGCLLMAVLLHSADTQAGVDAAYGPGRHMAMAAYAAIMAAYVVGRHAVQWVVGATLFGARANAEWLRSALLIAAAEGAALFPVTLLRVYFHMPMAAAAHCVLAIMVAARLLMLAKCRATFFAGPMGAAHLALYFTALEVAPLAALCGMLAQGPLAEAL